jgi:hypothetical protein
MVKGFKFFKLGMVVHTYNPITWEMKARGLWVQGHPGLHREMLVQKKKKKYTPSKKQKKKEDSKIFFFFRIKHPNCLK